MMLPNTPKDSSAIAKVQISNEYISFDLSLNSKKNSRGFRVFYPDWKAFLDGKEIEIQKVNYLLRGVIVPAGQHKLEMK